MRAYRFYVSWIAGAQVDVIAENEEEAREIIRSGEHNDFECFWDAYSETGEYDVDDIELLGEEDDDDKPGQLAPQILEL